MLLFAGGPKDLPGLFRQFGRHLFNRAEFHAESLTVVDARRLFPSCNAIGAQVTQVGWDGNLVPIEAVTPFARIIFLPRAIIKHPDTPLAYRKTMLFLASHDAGLTTGAVFVIDQ